MVSRPNSTGEKTSHRRTPNIAREGGSPRRWMTLQDHAAYAHVNADNRTRTGASGRFATQNGSHEADAWPHKTTALERVHFK